jgi:transposase
MDEMITIKRSDYEQLLSQNEELRKLVQQLREEIELLKNGHGSKTSSTPPSQDLSRSNSRSLRQSGARKPGGQKDHPGRTLSVSETPDSIVDHMPGVCGCCGCSLENVPAIAQTRRQVVDIPPVKPEYTEHRSFQKVCPDCGGVNRGVYPEEVKAPIQYGKNVKSMVAYLSVYQHLPYKRMTEFFESAYSLPVSQGSVDNILEEMSDKSKGAYEEIRKRISLSEVVGSDETGCRVNGKKHWIHVWQTKLLTFIVSYASRGYSVVEEYFPGGFLNSFYVSDCWASQLKVSALRHQLCIAHLLRELLNFEKSLNSQWSIDMKNLFRRALKLKKHMTCDDYKTAPAEVGELESELDGLLTVDATGFHAKKRAFIKRLIKHKDSIFTFLHHQNVPPDNNASERAVRNVKVKTKVSGQFRNPEGKGAERFARIRSIVDTAIKNGQSVFGALECLAKCRSS